MKLARGIAVWLVVVVLAAAPALATAARDCGSCCGPPTPCHETASDCGAVLAPSSCCDGSPAALPSVAKRTLEVPSVQAAPPLWSPLVEDVQRVRLPGRPGDLDVLISPLRLSVILRI
jgi:hypothetical protein